MVVRMPNTFSVKYIPKAIRYWRKYSGVSQVELAKRLEVSRQAIYLWETHQGYPDIERLEEVAGVLGIPLEFLLKEPPGRD